jgi:hypothetical protein
VETGKKLSELERVQKQTVMPDPALLVVMVTEPSCPYIVNASVTKRISGT